MTEADWLACDDVARLIPRLSPLHLLSRQPRSLPTEKEDLVSFCRVFGYRTLRPR